MGLYFLTNSSNFGLAGEFLKRDVGDGCRFIWVDRSCGVIVVVVGNIFSCGATVASREKNLYFLF